MPHSGLFVLSLAGASLVVFLGTLLLISVASLLAVIPFFLFASLAQLISVIHQIWEKRKIRTRVSSNIDVEERDLWKHEFRQNIASRAVHETEERRAS
jgi:hypothetical protein